MSDPKRSIRNAINFVALTMKDIDNASLDAVTLLLRAMERVAEAEIYSVPQADGDSGERWEMQ